MKWYECSIFENFKYVELLLIEAPSKKKAAIWALDSYSMGHNLDYSVVVDRASGRVFPNAGL